MNRDSRAGGATLGLPGGTAEGLGGGALGVDGAASIEHALSAYGNRRYASFRNSRGALGLPGALALALKLLATGAPVFFKVGIPTPAKIPPS